MSSRHPGCGHGTAGLPSGTVEDVAASKAFLCLKPAVRTKQWAAEGSCGKNRRPEARSGSRPRTPSVRSLGPRQALRVYPLEQGAQVRKLGSEELGFAGEEGGSAPLPLAPPMGTLECVPGVSLVRWGPSGQGRRSARLPEKLRPVHPWRRRLGAPARDPQA
ncbi:unnamed protein product [Rangifer tarandus platyrhynchus]|uniref:Uncharacterized protein n=1 Tax=Rangifer tarandus platyrhynchus TaxID=3082113 RepID=A0ABN8Y2Q8_RANTA|nr:unnamed protein product [Rangifer tarandus platyrhynchus]